ncbi:MATE family efflux transporter [Proteiniclasticum sp.]|uniref:MATE family efflux transporter n=1 Tax=Proteiniclasticum sp. TaxID=2053595 RepID=UPI00289C96B8|nr:MATE family efflux transporter [Proteiniclasticum sp.]
MNEEKSTVQEETEVAEKKDFFSFIKNPIRYDVMQLAWPVLIELLMSSLFGMVDMMMLGWIADKALAAASVAAVGITNQPMFIGLSLAQALNVGGTAMIARYVGAKQDHRVDSVLKHVILLNLVFLAIPLFAFGILFTDEIMLFMGAQADTLDAGRLYFKIIMVGYLFQSFNMSITAALRGIGETKAPMRINIRVNSLNVIGNAVLIYGLLFFPALGVTGAAISTALSHVVASVMMVRYITRKESPLKVNFRKKFRYNKTVIQNLIKVGVPASMESLALRIGVLLFVRIVAGLGTVIYASHQIALSILGLSFQPGQAFGIAASSMVGRSLGAKNLGLAEAYAKETRKIGSLISTFMALILFFFGRQLVSLYSNDPVIIDNASMALKIIAIVQPFQSSQLILAGALRGAGDTLWPLVATFIGVFGFRVVLANILVNTLELGLMGAWLAVLADQLIRWFFVYGRFRTNKWKYIKLK